jgi:DnaJ-class molecular chaperone
MNELITEHGTITYEVKGTGTKCRRCDGTGIYRWPVIGGMRSGSCFKCSGSGELNRQRVERAMTAQEAIDVEKMNNGEWDWF